MYSIYSIEGKRVHSQKYLIEESDTYPVIPTPSSDIKVKHRINSLNTRDDSNHNIPLYLKINHCVSKIIFILCLLLLGE